MIVLYVYKHLQNLGYTRNYKESFILNQTIRLTLFYTLLITTSLATAETKKLPIEITADSLIAQEKKGISIYQGNVIISQGKLLIKGDKVMITHPNQQISQAIITGKPATFKTFIKSEQSSVTGHANKITYNADKKTILFEEKAHINQAGLNSISGNSILYDTAKETIQAKGNKAKKERIKVIFTNQDKKS